MRTFIIGAILMLYALHYPSPPFNLQTVISSVFMLMGICWAVGQDIKELTRK